MLLIYVAQHPLPLLQRQQRRQLQPPPPLNTPWMIYDIINIVDAVLAIAAILIWLDVLSITKRRVFVPPFTKKWQIIFVYSFLSVSCFSFGYVLNGIFNGEYNDSYSVFTKVMCYVVWLCGSFYFWKMTKEKVVTITEQEI